MQAKQFWTKLVQSANEMHGLRDLSDREHARRAEGTFELHVSLGCAVTTGRVLRFWCQLEALMMFVLPLFGHHTLRFPSPSLPCVLSLQEDRAGRQTLGHPETNLKSRQFTLQTRKYLRQNQVSIPPLVPPLLVFRERHQLRYGPGGRTYMEGGYTLYKSYHTISHAANEVDIKSEYSQTLVKWGFLTASASNVSRMKRSLTLFPAFPGGPFVP